MLNLTIAGRIGKDAETRRTQAGDDVTSFSVATEQRAGREKVTTWVDVTLWGKRGTALAPYLTKGTTIAATGGMSLREHNGKTYVQLRADEVTLLGGGDRQEQRPAQRQAPAPAHDDLSDEVPF